MNPNCPSMQQLMGVVDMTDPCQSAPGLPNAAFNSQGFLTAGPQGGGSSILGNISPWMVIAGVIVIAAMIHPGR